MKEKDRHDKNEENVKCIFNVAEEKMLMIEKGEKRKKKICLMLVVIQYEQYSSN